MSIDVEYAIKKDIRNNPVVREIDREQRRDFVRTAWLAVAIVAMLLFSAWQHYRLLRDGYQMQQLQQQRDAEMNLNRKLRLEFETLRAPQVIERHALNDLHMTAPTEANTLVVERAAPNAAPGPVVAEIR